MSECWELNLDWQEQKMTVTTTALHPDATDPRGRGWAVLCSKHTSVTQISAKWHPDGNVTGTVHQTGQTSSRAP